MSNITTSSYFTGTGIIDGQAYIDNNNDGIKDNTITSTNAASTITSAVNNLFNDQLRLISVSLYTCKSLSSSDTEGVKLATSKLSSTGMYSFANLKSGNYYISASLPPENEDDDGVMYKFSSVWIGNSSKASNGISIARASLDGRSEKNENVFNNRKRRKRQLGTGGVVNTASDISTINPSTGRTNCFTLQEGERAMSYNFGLYPSSSTTDDSIEVKDAIYYNGFENDDFASSDPMWITSSWYDSNLVWSVSQDYPNNGRYALQSPILDTNEMRISKSSNVTLMLPDYYPYNDNEDSGKGGNLYFSVLASVQMPFDIFEYYVDNIKRGQLGQTTASNTYQQEVVKLSPGSHEIKFVYHFNPDDVPANFFPNSSLFDDVRFGLVAIDDLYFVPDWDYIPVQQQPTASPIQLGTKIPTQANTDTSVQPTVSSSSLESIAPTPTPIQDTSSIPSSMPSDQSSEAFIGTNISNIETALDDEDTSTDSSNTNIIIGLSCALIAIVLMTVAGLYIGMKRRRRKNDSMNEVRQEEVQVSGDLERGSMNRRRSDERSTSSHRLSVEEALERKDSYPVNSTHRPTTPTSNNSGQVTYYSSGTSKSFTQSGPLPIQQALSPVSSYTAGRYDEENLNKLEQEVASLSTAIESVPRESKTYQVLNLHLERAKEELDAVQQDIEMPSEELDIEEDTTSSTPVPYTEAIVPHIASADVDETHDEEDRSGGPSTRSKSPSTAEHEHEVWIHCMKREDNSIADSHITFDEQWAMENTKPDPEGITKYVTNPLDAITEYADDGEEGIPSEDGSKEEAKSIKSKLSLKQLTRFFKKHETS